MSFLSQGWPLAIGVPLAFLGVVVTLTGMRASLVVIAAALMIVALYLPPSVRWFSRRLNRDEPKAPKQP